MNPRDVRGRQIAERPNQIDRVDDAHYAAKSQSRDRLHDVIATE